VDDEDMVLWWPFGVSDLRPEVVLIESAKGPGWGAAGLVYIISKACMVVPPYLSLRSETYSTEKSGENARPPGRDTPSATTRQSPDDGSKRYIWRVGNSGFGR
jgi:hypothetical protein